MDRQVIVGRNKEGSHHFSWMWKSGYLGNLENTNDDLDKPDGLIWSHNGWVHCVSSTLKFCCYYFLLVV